MRAAHLLEMTGAILHSAFPAPLQILTHLRQKSKTFCILHSAFCISRAPTNPNAHLPNSLVGAATCRPRRTICHLTTHRCEFATPYRTGGLVGSQAATFHFPQAPCHPERGAPRSESKIYMIAGGNHTLIHVKWSRGIFAPSILRRFLDACCALTRNDRGHSAFCILHFAFCILHYVFCILHKKGRRP